LKNSKFCVKILPAERQDCFYLVFAMAGPPATPEQVSFAMAGGSSAKLMFYTYVLKSLKDGKLYVGCTNNLENRLAGHFAGKVESTKYRIPLDLIYYEACLDKSKAIKREKYFKTGFGRRFLKGRL
jgi:putative endonuclease